MTQKEAAVKCVLSKGSHASSKFDELIRQSHNRQRTNPKSYIYELTETLKDYQ
jgi:hypothetical protein